MMRELSLKSEVGLVLVILAGAFLVVGYFLYIGFLHGLLTTNESINLIFTSVIALFAIVQAYSTVMQVLLYDRQNKIEDIRSELEKAYGPLYSILSRPEELLKTGAKLSVATSEGTTVDNRSEELMIRLNREDKDHLDDIMICYPFIFPSDVVALWRVRIRDKSGYTFDARTLQTVDYAIPLKFRDRIEEEYNRRVKEYYKATGRPYDVIFGTVKTRSGT